MLNLGRTVSGGGGATRHFGGGGGGGDDNSDIMSHKSSRSNRSNALGGGSNSIVSELEEPLRDKSKEDDEEADFVVGARKDNQRFHGKSGDGSTTDDPFRVLREDLYQKLELVDESLTEFLRIVHQTDTAVNSHELKDIKKQLKRHLKNGESTLRDVKTVLTVVENDRVKFAHIDNEELYERRTLVHTSQDRLGRAKAEMTSEAVKAKLLADERAKALRRSTTDSRSSSSNNGGMLLGARNDPERENTSFIADSQARTSLLFQQQEETLEDLDEAVIRVGRMADNIHEEIGTQNKMLSELDDDLVDVEEQLGVVMGKLAKLLQTKSKWQLGTILILTITALVLFFLVIYS